MLAYQTKRRTREHTGPTPHSVAIKARMPSRFPPDHLILERRKQDDMREEAESLVRYNKMYDLKNDWESTTDRRIQQNTVKRKVKNMLQQEEFSLEDRRQRLRDLLSAEEDQYLKEMEDKQETVIERQAKMRERAKFLKDKREKERLQVVAEKLDQRWREECEELRSTLTRRHQDEVCTERMKQLELKDQMEQQRLEDERMYAYMWEQDRLAKAAREERETKEQMARNREVLETLQVQMAALQKQKLEEKRLVAEEAELLREQNKLRKLEEQRALAEKRSRQAAMRSELDKSLKLKMKKRAKEMQEELALDMKILEELLEESRNEAKEQEQRKRELREEQIRYRAYLRKQLEEEKEREKELDRVITAEVEKQWQKRLDQWDREHEARKRLMQEVLAERQKQVEAKLLVNKEKQEEARKECEAMLAAIEEHKRLEAEREAKVKSQNLQYQNDLEGQLDYEKRVKEVAKDEEYREYLKGLDAEAQYQAKLKEALSRPVIDKSHPMRKAYMARNAAYQ
ncbi:coiled-coil domain-containing protein 11-like [Saccoglossus kowalevskii]|uniref:Cilia- and flagella-associated protein 53 n=1 Tax=Saccoglossus kowalevskii TaxID=10224 RepID=A0ABM0GGW2_SACKO|nr:coiled-coil domain-containing protein 11-like [Saccoglossus kowalevskii]